MMGAREGPDDAGTSINDTGRFPARQSGNPAGEPKSSYCRVRVCLHIGGVRRSRLRNRLREVRVFGERRHPDNGHPPGL